MMKPTIFRKLLLSFTAVLSISCLVGGVGLYGLWRVKGKTERLSARTSRLQELAKLIDNNLLEAIKNEKDFLLSGDQGCITRFEQRIDQIRESCGLLSNLVRREGTKEKVAQIASYASEYRRGFLRVVERRRRRGSRAQGLTADFKRVIAELEEAVKGSGQKQLLIDLLSIRGYELEYSLYGEVSSISKISGQIAKFKADVDGAEISLHLKHNLKGLVDDYYGLFTKLVILDAGTERLRGVYHLTARLIEPIMEEISRESQRWSQEAVAAESALFRRSTTFVLSVLLLVIGLGVGLSSYLSRGISGPLVEISQAAGRIAKGDLTSRVVVKGRDEIGDLGRAVNEMTEELSRSREEIEGYNRTLEEKVKERTRELKIANRKLREGKAKVEEASRLKSQFLANMSHELRTPLNSIIGFSQVILKGIDGPLTPPQRQDLVAVHKSGKHLLGLINDVLDLSKIESGRMELQEEWLNLRELIEGACSTAGALVKGRDIKLSWEVDEDLPLIWADRTKLRQIILNLLSNAAKYTDRGAITLRANKRGEEVEISVADTGIGISAEDLPKVFEEFRQIKGAKARRKGGTGLGLTITKRLVEMHGGHIWAESKVGEGSTFRISLPLGPHPPKEEPVEGRQGGGRKVLVVDDDEYAVTLYRRYLEPAGYRVIGLRDGRKTLKRARELSPLAIILDIMLPGKDGWEIIQELKEDEELREIPVIISSVLRDRKLGLSLGAVDYLVKPVKEEELLAVMRRLDGRVQRIAVIDDDQANVELTGRILSREGYQIHKAYDGLGGLELVKRVRPDLVLLDLLMPGMNGFEVLAQLRKAEGTRRLPVIVVTAKDLTLEERARLDGDVESVLEKGIFTEEELVEDVLRVLRSQEVV